MKKFFSISFALLICGLLCIDLPAKAWWQSVPQNAISVVAGGVVVDSGSITTQYKTSAGTQTLTGVTVASGSNLALVVALNFDNNILSPVVTGLVWDAAGVNQALTLIKAAAGTLTGPKSDTQLWGLVGVTAGASKSITLTTTSSSAVFMTAIAFSGVNQTGGTTSFPGAVDNGGSNFSTLSVTSATGDKVIAATTDGTFGTPTGTVILNNSSSGSFVNALVNYDDGAAPVAIGQSNTLSASTGAEVATNIKAN